MFKSTRIAIAVALVSLAPTPSCMPVEAALDAGQAPDAAKSTAAVTIENDAKPNKDCWWIRVGKSESVAVWVSPRLAGEVPGGFRFVNLFFHDPKYSRPMAVFGSVVRSSRSEPLAIGNNDIDFSVAPLAGKSWADVARHDDLVVKLERLDGDQSSGLPGRKPR